MITRLHDRHAIIGSVTPYPVALARFGTSHLNTPEEVEELVWAVAAVAGG